MKNCPSNEPLHILGTYFQVLMKPLNINMMNTWYSFLLEMVMVVNVRKNQDGNTILFTCSHMMSGVIRGLLEFTTYK